MRQNASWGPQTVRPIYSISRIGRHGLMSFEAHLGRDKKLSVSAFKAVARAIAPPSAAAPAPSTKARNPQIEADAVAPAAASAASAACVAA